MKEIVSCISSVIVSLYGILNAVSIVLYSISDWERVGQYLELILTIDLLTWHVFSLFAVVTLIIKIYWKINPKKEKDPAFSKYLSADIILHFLFSAVIFISIAYLLKNAF